MTANSNVDTLRYALALSSVVTIATIVYVVVLVNTLIKIWDAEFQDPRERIFWFLFVLILSPIGMPLYLYKTRKQGAGKSEAAEKGQDSLEQRPREARGQKNNMSDADRARELARLLEMKKNGVLSKDEFNKAKKRLSV